MNRLISFLALLKKELIQLLKNPKTRLTIFLPMLVLLFLMGYAATMDFKVIPFSVLDHAQTVESRKMISAFSGGSIFQLHREVTSEKELERQMDIRDIKVAMVIPDDFSRKLLRGIPAELQISVDGRNSSSAGFILAYAQIVVSQFNRDFLHHGESGIRIQTRGWYNLTYEYRPFIVPSMLAMLPLLILTLIVALSFAKEREAGTMDQLLLTPYSPITILAAKGLSCFLIGVLQLALCMVLVRFWFKIPYVSEYWLLILLFVVFLSAAVGMGLALSVFCANLQQALISVFIVAIPCAMLAGVATPIASMPHWVQILMCFNPVRWGAEALHRLFLEGAGFFDILPIYVILAVIGSLCFLIAYASFVWRCRR